MVNDKTLLHIISIVFVVIQFVIVLSMWYYLLQHVQATNTLWFIWVGMLIFGSVTMLLNQAVYRTETRLRKVENILRNRFGEKDL